MKKQLILATLSAALVAAPFVDAVAKPSSGFSSSKSSSSFSSSKPSKPSSSWGSSSSSSKRDSGASWGSSASTSSAPAPKRDYGSSWGSVTPNRKAEPARPTVADYAPTNRVTPQPAAGFSDTKTSTKKKLATVAGATAVGGALYAAGANHEAVAAYQGSQEPAPTAAAGAGISGERSASAATTTDSRQPSQTSVPSMTYPTQQPQAIIVKEAPRYRGHDDDAYWYQRGRDSAARDTRINTPSAFDTPSLPQTTSRAQVVQPSAHASVVKTESSIGSVILWTFVILMSLGALGFFMLQVMNAGSPKTSSRPAARKPNYTL